MAITLVGQAKERDPLDEAALLTADEYDAVVRGTSLLVTQLQQQNPLIPREALYSGAVTLILGEIIRVRGSLKRYRELLSRLESSSSLSAEERKEVASILRPERSRLVLPGANTSFPEVK